MLCYNCEIEFTTKPVSKIYCSTRCAGADRQRRWRAARGMPCGKRKLAPISDRYLRTYGISEEEYNILFNSQNGKCKICHCVSNRKLSVDHSHSTGKIRGLLCHNCNVGLGHFKDDPILLQTALEYLNAS